jgi:uncharacterized repeat protein (TIGR03803 family)
VQASDGNFYGTTIGGGANHDGTAFKVTSTGTLTTLYSFCSRTNCADGSSPYAGLVQGSDGNFYGTTASGGASSSGTAFRITSTGTLTTVHSFCSQAACADGSSPYAGLVLATDGNFYGTTFIGGVKGEGTVFRLARVQFVSVVPPCRLVDTRNPDGEFGGPPLQGKKVRNFTIPDNKDCNIPSSAAAYSLNVTVVPHGPLDYLTVWPTGETQPLVSTLNSYDGRVKANAAIVPAGTNGALSFYVTDTTDLVLDIDGYFAVPNQSTVVFYPLPPCRVADTRDPSYPSGLGTLYLTGGVPRDFPVLKASMNQVPCDIPSSAQAYSLNLTAVQHGPLGFLSVWPTGNEPQQLVSTLNAYGGQVTANAAVVPAGTGGAITAYSSPGSDTDLVIDINGYFAPGPGGLSLYPIVPCRVLDTRPPLGNGPFNGPLNPPVDPVNSPCAVPSVAQAYVFNATVVPQGSLGYLTLWPDGGTQPDVSTLNAYDGVVTSNMAIVPAGNQGKVDAYAFGLTNLILDIFSYFAP